MRPEKSAALGFTDRSRAPGVFGWIHLIGLALLATATTGCQQAYGQPADARDNIKGIIEISSDKNAKMSLITVDIPTGGKSDGLFERAIILFAPSAFMEPFKGTGTVSIIDKWTVHVAIDRKREWWIVANTAPVKKPAPSGVKTSISAELVRRLWANTDEARGPGTPGTGDKTHQDFAGLLFAKARATP